MYVEEGIMSISIKLLDPIKKVEQDVNKAMAEAVNDIITKNIGQITRSVKSIIPQWLSAQPEIQSLLDTNPGSLVGQFGIKNSQQVVSSIINSVVDATEVKFVKYRSNLKGGLELNFQPSTFSNLLSLPEGHTVYADGDLHWLEWLLKRGDATIITNYQYNPVTGLGRSGLGNMIPGGFFRVPPQFSGTANNNFITRAFVGSNQEKQITAILAKILG